MPDPKKDLRKKIYAQRAALDLKVALTWSHEIVQWILASTYFQSAQTIMAYAALPGEVNVDPLFPPVLEADKRLFLPVTDWESKEIRPYRVKELPQDLTMQKWGIREPQSQQCSPWQGEPLDLVIVPGVAFDRCGFRLGFGQGFYDRFLRLLLEGYSFQPMILGVAFPFQILDSVYPEEHDMPVSCLISPGGAVSLMTRNKEWKMYKKGDVG